MKDEVLIHNLFRESPERFFREDPHLRRAALQPFSYVAPVIHSPEWMEPGILMITGGRQVGKTTCLKQFIAKVLRERLQSGAPQMRVFAEEPFGRLPEEVVNQDFVFHDPGY